MTRQESAREIINGGDLRDALQQVRTRFAAHPAPGRADSADPEKLRPASHRAEPRSWRPTLRRRRQTAAGSSGGRLIYAVGDVHGRADLLESLLAQVDQDSGGRPYVLIFCGDYIDRGPCSAHVVEWLVCLRRQLGDRLVLLKGNHEQCLLRFIDEPTSAAMWLQHFGGSATLRSYGVSLENAGTPGGLTAAREQLLDAMPGAHLHLLQHLDAIFVHHDYAFVHAGISPDAPLAEQTEGDLLWARDGFLEASGPFEKIIVHGHSWSSDRPTLLGHRIGLDTGAYETGVLTAVRILDAEHAVIQALDATAVERRVAMAAARSPRLVTRPADYVRAPPAEVRSMFERPTLTVGNAP